MLKQRLLTVAVVLPLFLALLFLAPNPVWGALSAVPIAVGAFEWARLARFSSAGRALFVSFVAISCAVLLVLSIQIPHVTFDAVALYPLCFAATVFWVLLVPTSLRFHWKFSHSSVNTAVGWLILVPTWLAAMAMQREPLLMLLMLGSVWIADTAAYFAGRRFGKHKLAPRISPGKTAEGLAGAYMAVFAYAAVVLWIYQPDAGWAAYMALLVFGFILTSLSVAGDLFESSIKRQAGAKDSGDLLPGHGGILDRIDSLTATIPFAVLFFAGMLA
jgi:phosphatidate cytidylyltransferase